MNKVKIFISDLDNTLFEACTNNIQEDDRQTVVKWKDSGNQFWVATGRGPDTLDMLAKKGIAPDTLVFSAGGGYRIGAKPPVYRGMFTDREAESVFNMLKTQFPEICYFLDVCNSDQAYFDGPQQRWLEHFHSSTMPAYASSDEYLHHSAGTQLLRIFCIAPSEDYLAGLKAAVADRYHGRFLCLHNDKNCADIIPAGNTKWEAVLDAIQIQGFTPDQCAAIGDDEADASMIQGCRIGFAMERGNEKAKKCADYIVPSVAYALDWLEQK